MSTTTLTTAKRIVERLKREDRARHDHIVAEAKQLRELYADREFKRAQLDQFNADHPVRKRKDGAPTEPPNDRKRATLEAELDSIGRDIAALEKSRKNRPAFLSGDRVADALERFARYREDPAEPVLKKGETHRAALDRYDSAINTAKGERKAILAAPRTAGEIASLINRAVNRLAARGAPRVAGMLHGGDLEMPAAQLPLTHGHHFTFAPDGVAMLCWLFPDLIKDRLTDTVEAMANDDKAMNSEEQADALRKLDAKLFKLHRERAAIVEQIIADGGEAFHRADAPIEAVLGISR